MTDVARQDPIREYRRSLALADAQLFEDIDAAMTDYGNCLLGPVFEDEDDALRWSLGGLREEFPDGLACDRADTSHVDIAEHEAGHAVVALAQQVPVTRMRLHLGGGVTDYPSITTRHSSVQVSVLLGGYAVDPSPWEVSQLDLCTIANEFHFEGKDHDLVLAAYHRAQRLVERYEDQLLAIAAELRKRRVLRTREIRDLWVSTRRCNGRGK